MISKAAVLAFASLALAAPTTVSDQSFNFPHWDDFYSPFRFSLNHEFCPLFPPVSCSAGQDSCCLEASNGIFLATQFWDFNPATGPADLFTTHGLWSDKCSGGYEQYCNPSWEVQNVTQTLLDLGMNDLLRKMQRTWKNQGNTDEDLWSHEFNKHGTCMATVNPECYYGWAPKNQNIGDFFTTVVDLQEKLPTYKYLKEAGITPTNASTYKKADIQAALSKHVNGKTVYLGCTKSGALQEVWYYLNLRGSVATGLFSPADADSAGSCPDDIWYIPKGLTVPGTTPPTGPTAPNKGYLMLENQPGCVISTGDWFVSGTCATFTVANTIGGVNITSSKGPCAVVNNVFTCGSGVTAGDFVLSGNSVTFGGQGTWSADHAPASQEKVPISFGTGNISFKMNFASNSTTPAN